MEILILQGLALIAASFNIRPPPVLSSQIIQEQELDQPIEHKTTDLSYKI